MSGLILSLNPLIMWPVLIGILVILTYAIAFACDHFEPAASYVGRNMSTGVKGATVNAIGSSMPELCSTIALLFFVGHVMVGPAVSVTVGSAIFNSAVIPMMVIFAVMVPQILRYATFGIVRLRNGGKSEIVIDKKSVLRDLIALIGAEIVLIMVLSTGTVTIFGCLVLLSIYAIYLGVMWNRPGEDGDSDYVKNPWITLLWTTSILVISCYFLAEIIVISAVAFGIHPIITALFIGAAASSVPDTILSVKDALKGNYEDAIANALGSNTFDICVALGGPLLFYILINGPIQLPDHEMITVLRIGLLFFTILIGALFLIPQKIKLWHGIVLLLIYALWSVFALNTEFKWF